MNKNSILSPHAWMTFLEGHNLELSFKGEFNIELINSILLLSSGKTELNNNITAIRNRLFSIIVEATQNICKHGADDVEHSEVKPGVISIGKTGKIAIISTGNLMLNAEVDSLKQKIEWINKQNDKEFPLNLTEYKEEQKELKSAYKDLDSLYKLKTEMKVKNIEADLSKFTADKEKTEKNKRFLNGLKSDIYLDEAVKVTNNMILQNNLALNNIKSDAEKKN